MPAWLRFAGLVLVVTATPASSMSPAGARAPLDAAWGSAFNVTPGTMSRYIGLGPQHTVAVDTFGNVHVVWYCDSQVGYRRFSGALGTWLPETIFPRHSPQSTSPAVACDVAGDVHLTWATPGGDSGGVWYKRYDAASQAWQPETLIFRADSGVDQGGASLACRPGGRNVHIVWQGRVMLTELSHVLHMEFVPGAGWTGATQLGRGTPCVVVDTADNVHVVWCESYDAMLRQRIGGTWLPVDMFCDNHSTGASVAVNPAGTAVHVAWKYYHHDTFEIRYRYRDSSGWLPQERFSAGLELDQNRPSICCAVDGRCDIAWEKQDSATPYIQRLYHIARLTDGNWTWPEPLTPAGWPGSRPCIIADRDSALHLVWTDYRLGHSTVWYMAGHHCRNDAAVFSVVAPLYVSPPRRPVVPVIAAANRGLDSARGIRAWLRIDSSGQTVYIDSADVSLIAAGDTVHVEFGQWQPGAGSSYQLTSWVVMAGDGNAANDTYRLPAGIISWPNGWHEVRWTLGTVERGGWLTYMDADDRFYLVEGNERDFHRFDPVRDTWVHMAHFGYGIEGKVPKKGSKGIADHSRFIYATKGNNSTGFWSYDIVTDSWRQLDDVPLGASGNKVKGGTDIEYVPGIGSGMVYLLKGNYNEFYRYNPATNRWEGRAPTPITANPKWTEGSWLVYDGDRTIYAHKAKYHELWKYDVLKDSWSARPLRGMPFIGMMGKTKKSKDGGSAAWYNGQIYALKGGNTQEFWRYFAARDSWAELETVPQIGHTGRKKRIKSGGDIAGYGYGVFFACKGNKTTEVWRYVLPDYLKAATPASGTAGAMARAGARAAERRPTASIARQVLWLPLVDGPGSVTAQLLDASGRRVMQLTPGLNDIRHVAPGIYFVSYRTTGELSKVVIAR